jgi:hypothetical protein
MVNNWKHLNFFDKNGKYLNFNYNQSEDMWSGTMYLPEVSIGLFEVGQIFILEEFVNKTTNLKEFGFPHGVEVATGTPGLQQILKKYFYFNLIWTLIQVHRLH